LLAIAQGIGESSHEQAFTGQQAFAGRHQFTEETICAVAAVAENGGHDDAIVHEHKAPGFRDNRFLRIEFDFDALHFFAVYVVINFVIAKHGGYSK